MKAKLIAVMFSLLVSTAHSALNRDLPIISDTIEVPGALCTSNTPRYNNDFSNEMTVCYEIEYQYNALLPFVWIDTLQGTFFGLCKNFHGYQNINKCSFEDLIKTFESDHKGLLYVHKVIWVLRRLR